MTLIEADRGKIEEWFWGCSEIKVLIAAGARNGVSARPRTGGSRDKRRHPRIRRGSLSVARFKGGTVIHAFVRTLVDRESCSRKFVRGIT